MTSRQQKLKKVKKKTRQRHKNKSKNRQQQQTAKIKPKPKPKKSDKRPAEVKKLKTWKMKWQAKDTKLEKNDQKISQQHKEKAKKIYWWANDTKPRKQKRQWVWPHLRIAWNYSSGWINVGKSVFLNRLSSQKAGIETTTKNNINNNEDNNPQTISNINKDKKVKYNDIEEL